MPDRPGSFEFAYVQSDIPAGMTIREWRASRPTPRRRRLRATGGRVLGRAIARARWIWLRACGCCSVLPASQARRAWAAVKCCPDGSLRES